MDNTIIINGVTDHKVEGFECSKCDLKKDNIAIGFCGGFVTNCSDFHYEAIKECGSCSSYGGDKLICSRCHKFDLWEDKNG